jgi:hypothetical protein
MIPTRNLRRRKLSSGHSKAAIFVVVAFPLVAPLLFAHHGLAAFDTTHTVKMSGVVTDFQFINPHS